MRFEFDLRSVFVVRKKRSFKSKLIFPMIILLPIPCIVAYLIWSVHQHDLIKSKYDFQIGSLRELATNLLQYEIDYGAFPEEIEPSELFHYDVFNQSGENARSWQVALPVGPSDYNHVKMKLSPILFCKDEGWVYLISMGPDQFQDIDCNELELMKVKTYDPTNGIVSGGDIFRVVR